MKIMQNPLLGEHLQEHKVAAWNFDERAATAWADFDYLLLLLYFITLFISLLRQASAPPISNLKYYFSYNRIPSPANQRPLGF
jgi:hypothetical protein